MARVGGLWAGRGTLAGWGLAVNLFIAIVNQKIKRGVDVRDYVDDVVLQTMATPRLLQP